MMTLGLGSGNSWDGGNGFFRLILRLTALNFSSLLLLGLGGGICIFWEFFWTCGFSFSTS